MDDFEQLDHYELLGVSRSASAEEIKQAYRQQMRRYHPDRLAGASSDEQAYAGMRALRINEAYQTLSDFSARSAYNRSLGGRVAAPPRPHPAPPRPRDHQAELYDRAHEHLDAGRALQAIATLRELLQLNPFYRDGAALLAQAEAAVSPRPAPQPAPRPAPRSTSRRALLIGGASSLLLAAAGAAAWWLRRATAAASPTTQAAASPTQADPNLVAAAPTALSEPPSPTATSAPTAMPSETPEPPSPTSEPTRTPAPLSEEGQLRYSEEFYGDDWPTTSGSGWSVTSGGGAYTITAKPGVGNIWAYRTSPAGQDMLVGVDVAVRGGEAGFILRFSDENNYLAFFVNPAARSFRLEQHISGKASTLLDEAHPAVRAGTTTSNRIVARLEGEQIGLRVNGQAVAALNLSTPPPTLRYGLAAIAGDSAVEATFRNLSLRAL